MHIRSVHARQILDSRGNPTIESEITLESGVMGRAAVPSGASTGSHEAHELRDGDPRYYGGKSVLRAVESVQGEIQAALLGRAADDQFALDDLLINLDDTPDKSRLGANALLSVSLAAARAAAFERKIPLYRHLNDIANNPPMSLPLAMMNIVNGGKHAPGGADFQEGMVICAGAKTIADAVRMGSEIFHALQTHLSDQDLSTQVGDEGGFAISVSHNAEVLELLRLATLQAGYVPGKDVVFALDVAATELLSDDEYRLAREARTLSADEMIALYQDLVAAYPLVSIEDGLSEDAWDDWSRMTAYLTHTQLVGDDLLVTNEKRLQKAIDSSACNAILIKPNQIGTLTETIRAVQAAKSAGFGTIISHRSGETEDTFIAHLAVGTGAGQIKTGSLSRTDRVGKYNELLRIADTDDDLALAQPFRQMK